MKRFSMTKSKRVRIFDEAKGICHLCNLPIRQGEKWEVEHPIALGLGGSDKEEDLRPAHAECHKPKTVDDKTKIAKTIRMRAAHIGAEGTPKQKILQRGKPEKPPPKPLPVRQGGIYARFYGKETS